MEGGGVISSSTVTTKASGGERYSVADTSVQTYRGCLMLFYLLDGQHSVCLMLFYLLD